MKRLMLVTVGSMLLAAPAWAQVGPTMLLKPWKAQAHVESEFDALLQSSGHSEAAGSPSFQMQVYDASARARLDSAQQYGLTFGFDMTYLNLDTTDTALPERLVDQQVAVGMTIGQCQDWRIDLVVGGGYAGNNPFADSDALYARGDIIATRSLDEKSSIQVMLDYHGNRSFLPDVPLPAVAYSRKESDTLAYTLGVPYSTLSWQPADRWSIDLGYAVPVTLNATVSFKLTDTLVLFAAFENRLDAFHIDGDLEHRRLFVQQRRIELGVRWDPCPSCQLVVAGGYAFSEDFERGFDLRDTTTVRDVSDEPYVRAGVSFSF